MTPEKQRLILNLKNSSFCKLGVSKIHGIGVFAFKEIPEKTSIFRQCNQKNFERSLVFSEQEMESILEKEVSHYLKCFFAKSENNSYPVPACGTNSFNASFYLNHSESPNLKGGSDIYSKSTFLSFFSVRRVEVGEELLIDYFKEFGKEAAEQFLSL